jgi:hypothetical protein
VLPSTVQSETVLSALPTTRRGTLAVIAAISLLSDNVRNAIENVAGILPG